MIGFRRLGGLGFGVYGSNSNRYLGCSGRVKGRLFGLATYIMKSQVES